MKVLILRFPYQSTLGGLEKHTLNLVDALTSKGITFSLISNCPTLLEQFKERKLGRLKIWAGPDPVSAKALALFPLWVPFFAIEICLILLYYRLFKRCRRLYCLSLTEKIIATRFAKLIGYKVIWAEHTLIDNWLTKNPLRVIYRWLSKHAKITAVSFAVKKQLLELGVDSERIAVIHNGIDQAAYSQNQVPASQYKRTFVIGTACRLSPEKGVPVLLQATKLAQDVIPNLRVIIIGDGPEKNALLWLTKNLQLENRVQFVGWQDQLSRWLINFDIFVLASTKREAFGAVLLEAMALGRPVVASRIGGIPEIVDQNKTGLLVEAGNHEMLAQAIINLYNNPDWMKQMGQSGIQRVIANFSFDRMASKYFDLLG